MICTVVDEMRSYGDVIEGRAVLPRSGAVVAGADAVAGGGGRRSLGCRSIREELDAARNDPGTPCGVARTLRVLDGKWTTLIVRELLGCLLRFGDLHAMLRWGRANPA